MHAFKCHQCDSGLFTANAIAFCATERRSNGTRRKKNTTTTLFEKVSQFVDLNKFLDWWLCSFKAEYKKQLQ